MRVDFHVHVTDRVLYTHRLIRKARKQGALLTVVGPREVLHALDVHLWTWEPLAFLPHAHPDAPLAVQQCSPVLLREQPSGNEPPDVLINLSIELPLGYQRWSRMIDIVSAQASDLGAARQRWRQLLAEGHQPQKHELPL